MKRFYRTMVIAFAIAMLVTGLAFSEGGAEASQQEALTIKWFGHRGFPGANTPIKGMLEDLVSERVGYPVTFDLYGDPGLWDGIDDALVRYLAANDLPDVFNQHGVGNGEFLEQAAAPYSDSEFRNQLPNWYKWHLDFMEQAGSDVESTFARYKNDDGDFWGIPGVWATGWVPSGQMWRKDILDELGYDIPTTLAEAEQVFEAYKSVYPDKYALTGRGQLDWQCFDLVFNAFGITGGGDHIRDGKIVQFYATREFRESLQVLRRWYEKGFWDPNFVNHSLEWVNNFANGEYLVTQWIKDWNYPDGTPTRYLENLREIPGAMAVAATHLAADANTKPTQRTWDPYTGGLRSFGRHLLNDKEKMYKVMEVIDLAPYDQEIGFLAAFGIEGEHYTIPEGEERPQLFPEIAGMTEQARVEKYGFGYYWQPFGGVSIPMSSIEQKKIDDFVLPPDAIYGVNNLDRWQSHIRGQVTDESGEPVQATTPTPWFDMVVAIMTGAEPIEYYDEWLETYYDSGGRLWEERATALYLD